MTDGKSRIGRTLSRRNVLALGALAAGTAAFPRPALVQTRRKVTMIYGVPTIENAVAFISSIPLGAGFFAEEGLDATVQSVNGSQISANMLANGQAQFTTGSSGGLFSGVGEGVPLKAFICQVPDSFLSLAVPAESDVTRIEQLKGKVIGVSALGGGTFVIMKAIAKRLGWVEGKDITFLAVGSGLPAWDALRRDRVQGLFLWDSPFSLLEASGAKLRHIKPEPLPQLGFNHNTHVQLEFLEKEPETVAAMARALAKSLVFMSAVDPVEATKLHYKVYPESKPQSLSEADILRRERIRFQARCSFMRFPQRVTERKEKLGDETDARIEIVRDMLLEAGEIKQALPVDRYFTRQFLDTMNGIDIAAVVARAKAFKV